MNVKEEIKSVKDDVKHGVKDAKDDVKNVVRDAKDDIQSAARDVTEGAKDMARDIKAKVSDSLSGAREIAGDAGTALQASGKAYASGLSELANLIGEVARETLNDTSSHLQASVRAKSVRELAEMQAEYAQRRLEMGATYSKEYIDLLYSKTLEIYAPFGKMLNKDAV